MSYQGDEILENRNFPVPVTRSRLGGAATLPQPCVSFKYPSLSILWLGFTSPLSNLPQPIFWNGSLQTRRLADLIYIACLFNTNKDFPNSKWWWFESHKYEADLLQWTIDVVSEQFYEPWNILIAAVIILDRVIATGAPLTETNVVRLFGACLGVAIKLVLDTNVCNSELTTLLNCPTPIIHILEAEVLKVVNWEVFVSEANFAQYTKAITWPFITYQVPAVSIWHEVDLRSS